MKVDWPKPKDGALRLDLEAVAFAEYVVGAQPNRPNGTGRGLAANAKGEAIAPVAMFASHEKEADADFGRMWLSKDRLLAGHDRTKWSAWDAWCVYLLRRPMFAQKGKFRRTPIEQRQYRIRLCPDPVVGVPLAEAGKMEEFARRFMAGLERDYGGKFVYVGGCHFNTPQPHAHIGMRGISMEGDHVFFSQKYLRPSAEDLQKNPAASSPIEWRARTTLAQMVAEMGGARAAG